MGRLIQSGKATRQQVAIIYDVGISTLYKKFPVDKLAQLEGQGMEQ